MPKQYTIGTRQFSTQKQLRAYIHDLIARYRNDEPLAASDHQFVLDLLALHQECDVKVGCGISHFVIRTNFNHGGRTQGFWIVRLDGSETDFSWVKCLTPATHAQDVRKAFRDSIGHQILEFKQKTLEAGVARCPFTGIELSLSNSHADHIFPDTFMSLLNDFLCVSGLEYDDVAIEKTKDGDVYKRLVDRDLESKWLTFHKNNAKLRLLSRTGNLSHAKKHTDLA